jgi:assimilatory nitrate reductase catalytic subunit
MRVLMKKIQSTCNLCALACNIDFHVENGKIEKVSPTVDYPVNQGFCCIKGLNLDKQQTKIKARKTPLLRDENGELLPIEKPTKEEIKPIWENHMEKVKEKHNFKEISKQLKIVKKN